MKKLTLSLLAIAALSFGSCKKDYTCNCTINGVATPTVLKNTKKSTAKDACSKLETGAKIIDAKATCTL